MNGESNGDRTDAERAASERMRELGRRSGEARRRKREQREAGELELSDREQAKAALRRALDGGNHAAMVAAAKALIEWDHSPELTGVTVADARAQLIARLDAIEDRRRADGLVCPTCDRPLPRDDAAGRGRVTGSGPTPRHMLPPAVASEEISPVPPVSDDRASLDPGFVAGPELRRTLGSVWWGDDPAPPG